MTASTPSSPSPHPDIFFFFLSRVQNIYRTPHGIVTIRQEGKSKKLEEKRIRKEEMGRKKNLKEEVKGRGEEEEEERKLGGREENLSIDFLLSNDSHF